MKSFVTYFIKYPIASNLLMVLLFLLGIFGMLNMRSTFFPEVESRIINIQAIYPGSSPEEIEEGIVAKIEENLKGLTGVERSTSISSENLGTVTVEVERGYSTDVVLEDVKNAVDQINSFPDGMEPVTVFKVENLGFAISFSISGEVDLGTLKMFGRRAEEDLRNMGEISKVSLSGFPDEEIEIAFREKDLQAYQISFTQATQAVRAANVELTGGTLKGDKEELLVRARNKSYYAKGLRDIVVKTTSEGSVIYLHQVADLIDKWADDPNRTYMNQKPAIIVTVQNTLEEDMLTIVEKTKEYIEKFNAQNDLVKATIVRDDSVVLEQRIDMLAENGILGFMIVLFLLALFLNWRLAFWVALSIPISFAGMFLVAYLIGISINVLSLFGMIIVIGILVDDGIVISENIYQMYEDGIDRDTAAVKGLLDVLPAVFSAITTTIIVFSAFFFIDGRLGDFFSELAIVVILSLVFSLVEGALILPTHVAHSEALAPNRTRNPVSEALDKFMFWMRDKLYGPVLKFAIENRFFTLSAITAMLVLTFGAVGGGIIKTTFFPVIERDNVIISLQMPAGTREQFTQKWLDHIESAVLSSNTELNEEYFNNEKQIVQKIEKTLGPSSYKGTINLSLLDGDNRGELSTREVINRIRAKAGAIPEAEVVTYGSQSAFGKPVSVSLVGENYKELKAATEEVKAELNKLAELSDVVDNNQEGLREINVTLKDKARFLGLTLQDVVGQVRQGFFGSEVQRLQRGRDEVKVWVRYAEKDRKDLAQLQNMRLRFADGREFPLSEVANLNIQRGVIAINHIDGKREVKIESDISNDQVSVSDITTNVKEKIVPRVLANYPTVQALFEGQNREQEKSQASMQMIIPVVALLMFFTIALTFRSISQTFVVLAIIPFGFIGAAWGHWFMGTPISLFSVLGLFALVGILVNDALVFVTTYNSRLQTGEDQMRAIYRTGLSRFRAILLTSVTTIAGLAPLIFFEKSLQAQFLIPMAISVAFGLGLVTLIILVLLPVLLIISNRIKVYALFLWNGVKPPFETVEAASPEYQSHFMLWLAAGIVALGGFIGIIIAFNVLAGILV